jgi:hypothetical protein
MGLPPARLGARERSSQEAGSPRGKAWKARQKKEVAVPKWFPQKKWFRRACRRQYPNHFAGPLVLSFGCVYRDGLRLVEGVKNNNPSPSPNPNPKKTS